MATTRKITRRPMINAAGRCGASHVAVKMPEDVDTDPQWLRDNVLLPADEDARDIVSAYIGALEARDE